MLVVAIDSFGYPETQKKVLSKISFQVTQGEHLAILGASGCGKSTLLHSIFGLLNLENGSITYKNKPLFGPSHNLIPGHSFMKLVSQDVQLMPFTTVAENIGENLERVDVRQDAARIDRLLHVVGLEAFKNAKVTTLSGGQKQRVALAKALANPPQILLLDEPFSSIDTFQKNTLRRALYAYLKTQNISCITATHDSNEALAFADKLLLMKDGSISLAGTPNHVFSQIAFSQEAHFFGEATQLPEGIFATLDNTGKTMYLSHELTISKEKTAVAAVVEKSYFKGRNYLVRATWNEQELFFEHSEHLEKGRFVYIQPV